MASRTLVLVFAPRLEACYRTSYLSSIHWPAYPAESPLASSSLLAQLQFSDRSWGVNCYPTKAIYSASRWSHATGVVPFTPSRSLYVISFLIVPWGVLVISYVFIYSYLDSYLLMCFCGHERSSRYGSGSSRLSIWLSTSSSSFQPQPLQNQ